MIMDRQGHFYSYEKKRNYEHLSKLPFTIYESLNKSTLSS